MRLDAHGAAPGRRGCRVKQPISDAAGSVGHKAALARVWMPLSHESACRPAVGMVVSHRTLMHRSPEWFPDSLRRKEKRGRRAGRDAAAQMRGTIGRYADGGRRVEGQGDLPRLACAPPPIEAIRTPEADLERSTGLRLVRRSARSTPDDDEVHYELVPAEPRRRTRSPSCRGARGPCREYQCPPRSDEPGWPRHGAGHGVLVEHGEPLFCGRRLPRWASKALLSTVRARAIPANLPDSHRQEGRRSRAGR